MDLMSNVIYNKDGSIVVKQKKIDIYIPRSYEKYKMLSVTDVVVCLGIFEITIDNETRGFFVPAVLQMQPTEVKFVTINGKDYLQATFLKGDTFIKSKNVVKNGQLAFIIFSQYIEKAQVPSYFDYQKCAFIFDIVQQITGCKLPADHAVFEMIWGYLSRDSQNIRVAWRHSSMNGTPIRLKLKEVPHTAQSTTSKLVGAYLKDSIAASMVNASQDKSDIEDLLRQ